MMIRFDGALFGEHVHIRVWVGTDRDHLALAGDLRLRVPEWEFFKKELLDGNKTCEWTPAGPSESVAIFDSLDSMQKGVPYAGTLDYLLRGGQ